MGTNYAPPLTYILLFSNKAEFISIYSRLEKNSKHLSSTSCKEKKEEIWLSHMRKAATPTEKSKKETWQHKNATKNFDYTTIADLLRTVNWGNNIHPTWVVKPVHGIPTFPLTKMCNQKDRHLNMCK